MKPIFSPTKVLDSLILLQLQIDGPQHGYALAASFEEKFGWKPSQTAIYNSLKSLEQDDLADSEEKIESGRVQKIYAITERGKSCLEEIHQNMRQRMMKGFTQFFSVMQMLIDSGMKTESEDYRRTVEKILVKLPNIPKITMLVGRKDPEETYKILENTMKSLKKLAEEHGIEFQESEEFEAFP